MGGVFTWATFFKLLFMTGVSVVAQALTNDDYDEPDQKDPGLKINTRSTQALIAVLYGQVKTAGNDVYVHGAGFENDDLWVVQAFGEGEIDSIVQVAGEDQIFFGDTLISDYEDKSVAEYWFHGGSSSQTVDTNLQAADPRFTDNMRHTAYVVFHLTFNRKYYQSLPRRQMIVKGRKLYDIRDTTTAWSDNPVLCLYDYLTNGRYGLGLASAAIDTTSWTSAANYCDTKGWTLDLEIREDEAAIDTVKRILAHFRGTLIWYDGKYYLRYADTNYESSIMTIRDYNIAQGQDGRAMIGLSQPGRYSRPDGIRVKFIDPDRDYVVDDLIIGDQDGVVKELRLLGCGRQQAADLATYHLERAQLDRTVAGTFSDDCLQLEPHDLVTLTSTALGIAGQLMRVLSTNIRQDGLVDLSLIYESEVLYNDDYDLDVEGAYECALPDPKAEPPSVSNVSITEETYAYRDRTYTRLQVTFDEPVNYAWFHHIEVYLSYDNSVWKHLFDAVNDFNVDNVEEGAHYYIRLKTVNIWGAEQLDAHDFRIDLVVAGLTAAPTSLTALIAIVNQTSVNLYASGFDSEDTPFCEFRLGSTWSGGVFLARQSYGNLSLSGVKPGSHSFAANTVGNNGEYGGTVRTVTAETIKLPPDGWSNFTGGPIDFSLGTHSNTERITSGAYTDYMKCSHTSGNLTGTWTSPEWDLTAEKRFLMYHLGEIVVVGAGTDWDTRAPSGSTDWDDINADTQAWNQLFSLTEASQVTIKWKYGNTSGSLTGAIEHAEILSGIATARYWQLEITITDPSDTVTACVEDGVNYFDVPS